MKKVYYAHCVAIYDTVQEERDILTLQDLDLFVFNPNCEEVREGVIKYKEENGHDKVMDYFKSFVEDCDVFAFRTLPDGRIPSGVAFELNHAKQLRKTIIELPSGIISRTMNYELTKEYLLEIGNR